MTNDLSSLTEDHEALDSTASLSWRTWLWQLFTCLTPLIVFTISFYIVVLAIIWSHGLKFVLFPVGELRLAAVLLIVCVMIGPMGLLAIRIARDMILQIRGGEPPPLRERTRDLPRFFGQGFLLTAIYLIGSVPYVNLKPAIPLINSANYDAETEALERSLFAGTLPSEWLIERTPAWGVWFWDSVYGIFTLFMFISLTIALHHEGFKGGARLVLAYQIGLMIDVLFTLAIPTRGPLFVHPEWFHALDGLPSGELSAFLLETIAEYQQSNRVYACAGISAMPSYHVYAWICGFLCWRHLSRPLIVVGVILSILNWLSTIVLGWHYALDGLAGIVLALLVCRFTAWLMPLPQPSPCPE
ncbi:MAG: hypothetical protein KatS3mg105_3711 [Gemmatales bacterium]|nr:MAG: hypothetical protein KatS3mg105_3711 [Gemmatales bacterium]